MFWSKSEWQKNPRHTIPIKLRREHFAFNCPLSVAIEALNLPGVGKNFEVHSNGVCFNTFDENGGRVPLSCQPYYTFAPMEFVKAYREWRNGAKFTYNGDIEMRAAAVVIV